MRDMIYCDKCNQYTTYKRGWNIETSTCNKCAKAESKT
jgi:hypothetical protein